MPFTKTILASIDVVNINQQFSFDGKKFYTLKAKKDWGTSVRCTYGFVALTFKKDKQVYIKVKEVKNGR